MTFYVTDTIIRKKLFRTSTRSSTNLSVDSNMIAHCKLSPFSATSQCYQHRYDNAAILCSLTSTSPSYLRDSAAYFCEVGKAVR